MKAIHILFFVFLLYTPFFVNGKETRASYEKVLICGVCRNVAFAVPNTIQNIEALGKQFKNYRVIIYENDSIDNTTTLLDEWAQRNKRVIFISEKLSPEELALSREERIANARNNVLSVACDSKFRDYKYLIMVDLDFVTPWPIEEIVASLETTKPWDCIAANGIRYGMYWDRYAFRNINFPFGFELIGPIWWPDLFNSWFPIDGEEWGRVFSAFGGLAIYKTAVITQFSYSGKVTKDLERFYKKIFPLLSPSNPQVQRYTAVTGNPDFTNSPVVFQSPICCEHVTLHASMFIRGFNRFYINPKMRIVYQ